VTALYTKFFDRFWRRVWVDLGFFGLRRAGNNERDRGWVTWLCWASFWIILPLLVICLLSVAITIIFGAFKYGIGIFILLFVLHCWAVWSRFKKATDAIVTDLVQASWFSSAVASMSMIAIGFLGVSLVSIASVSVGMSFSMVSFFEASTGHEEQPSNLPEASDVEEEAPRAFQEGAASDLGDRSLVQVRRIETATGLDVWWRVGDSSNPIIGFDAVEPLWDRVWDKSEVCGSEVLIVVARASSDGKRNRNSDLSRHRALRLSEIVSEIVEGCVHREFPHVIAFSLGQSNEVWHDGAQRVARILSLNRNDEDADDVEVTPEVLSLVQLHSGIDLGLYPNAEFCIFRSEPRCDWQPAGALPRNR
jgi:hypothetical protein